MAIDKSKGWVKIYRSMMDHRNYDSEPFCRPMAWIDLILLANHKTGSFRVRGILVTIERGQVGYGLDELAERWQWSRGKVERFMRELEIEGEIVRQKNNVITLITIVNYEDEQANNKAGDNTDGQQTVKQTEANKNVKNDKNVKKGVKNKILFRESEIFDPKAFMMAFFGTEWEALNTDLEYYYNSALNWSDSNAEKKVDWVATVRNWMQKDRRDGKLKTINPQAGAQNGISTTSHPSIKPVSEILGKYENL